MEVCSLVGCISSVKCVCVWGGGERGGGEVGGCECEMCA